MLIIRIENNVSGALTAISVQSMTTLVFGYSSLKASGINALITSSLEGHISVQNFK